MNEQRECKQCGEAFVTRRPNKRFCRVICGKRWWNQNREPQRPNVYAKCRGCGREFERYVEPSKIVAGLATNEWCSRSCRKRETVRPGRKKQTGRIVVQSGYVMIWAPDHPHANNKGYVFEHRLVMESHLGRYLAREEVVHHRNDNATDNRLENLELFANNAEHKLVHEAARRRDSAGRYLPVKEDRSGV